MPKKIFFPFDAKTGELLVYVRHDYPDNNNGTVKWSENYVFEDDLEYDGYARGNSAARILFRSLKDGKRYEMFLTDFDDAMRRCLFFKNRLIGKFTFIKRGQNYGVKIATVEKVDDRSVKITTQGGINE